MSSEKEQKTNIVIGNWKMKKDLPASLELAKDLVEQYPKDLEGGEIVVCPEHVSLTGVSKELEGTNIKLGAQNVFWEHKGSFTGETSPETLQQAGCQYVIIGHSERRRYLLEDYSMIHQKVKAVLNTEGLIPIVCVGESEEEEQSDNVIVDQLQQALGDIHITKEQQVIVAYEPVWAIGSGTPVKPEEAQHTHKVIRSTLNDMYGTTTAENNFRVIYGGSMDSGNVGGFAELEDLDGLLLGGASLEAEEFYKVAQAIL